MPATLAPPVCSKPRSRDIYAVPEPATCVSCGGVSADLDVELPCGECWGSGVGRAWFRLKPARTLKYRRVLYRPSGFRGEGVLWLTTGRKDGGATATERYGITEFPTDWDGRAFYVAKIGTDRLHEAFVGRDGSVSCSCEGTTYASASKADQRAHECGERTFRSLGCIHLDSLRALLSNGWFDLT